MKLKTMMTIMMMASAAVGADAQELNAGVKTSNLDVSVRPQDDFYEYACGGWAKQHPLPAAYSRYGTFDQLQEDNDKRINAILDELKKGSYAQWSRNSQISISWPSTRNAATRTV